MVRIARRALAAIHSRRSTAVLEVSMDLWTQRVDHEDLAPEQYRSLSQPVDVAGIERLAAMLRDAKTPVLLVGHRAVHRGSSADLLALCEQQDIPCATVDYAKGAIPEDHPLSLGIMGSCGHESASAYLQKADLIIALGTRMSSQTTFDYDESLFPQLVHIDECPEEPGRNFKLRLGIVSDLPSAVRALAAASGPPVQRGSALRVQELRNQYKTYQVKGRAPTSTPAVLSAIREVLPRSTLVVGDCGLTLQYVKQFFPVYSPDGFYALYSLAAMGGGLPLAIGVQLARPDDVVLCMMGDGGTLVHLTELAVAAHYNLPLIVVICNNHSYKQVGDRMDRYLTTSFGCTLPDVDFAAAARACGCDGYKANDAAEAAKAVQTALERRKTSVIEVQVKGDNLFDVTPARITRWWDRIFPKPGIDPVWPFPKNIAKP
jgi:acetolactate synthase-1/2/3 large subunit